MNRVHQFGIRLAVASNQPRTWQPRRHHPAWTLSRQQTLWRRRMPTPTVYEVMGAGNLADAPVESREDEGP